MLSRIDRSLKAPQALVVAPTRELVNQIAKVTIDLAQFTDIKVSLCTAGEKGEKITIRMFNFVLLFASW